MIILFVLSAVKLFAQEEEKEIKYIFGGERKPGKEKIEVSGFIAPIMGFSAIDDEFAFFMGGGGAVLLNQTFYIGAFGEGLTTRHYPKNEDNLFYQYDAKISFGYGGFWLGYIHKSQNPVHFGVSTRLGWGSIYYDQYYKDVNNHFPVDKDYLDNVFVFVPQIEAEFNFFKWMKINVGIGYRVVAGINKEYEGQLIFDKKDFNKPQATLTLCFGYFK